MESIVIFLICLSKDYIDFKLPTDRYHTAKTQFYQQSLNCWFSIKIKKPMTVDEILNENPFYNKFILIIKSCLETSLVDNNKQTKMIDLIKLDGSHKFPRNVHQVVLSINTNAVL